jgi:hypothetical protein
LRTRVAEQTGGGAVLGLSSARPDTTAMFSHRSLDISMWLTVSAVFLPSCLVLLASGRPAEEALPDAGSPALRLLGLIPGLMALAVLGLPLLRELPRVRFSGPAAALLTLLAWTAFSAGLAGELAGIGEGVWVIAGLAAALAVAASNVSYPVLPLAVAPLAAVGILSLLLLAVDPDLALLDEARSPLNPLSGRLAGITDHPNLLGSAMGVLLVLAVAGVPGRSSVLPIVVALTCLLLSESRTSLIAALLATLSVLAVRHSRTARPLLARSILLLSLSASIAACATPLMRPLAELNQTLSTRPNVWSYVVERLHDRWVVGHGPTALADARETDGLLPVQVTHAHNLLLDQLYATGVVGTVILLVLLAAAAVAAARQAGAGHLHGLGLIVLLATTAPIEVTLSLVLNPVSALTLAFVCLAAPPPARALP